MKDLKIVHKFPTDDEFLQLFESVGWKRKKRVQENRKHSCFAVSKDVTVTAKVKDVKYYKLTPEKVE